MNETKGYERNTITICNIKCIQFKVINLQGKHDYCGFLKHVCKSSAYLANIENNVDLKLFNEYEPFTVL